MCVAPSAGCANATRVYPCYQCRGTSYPGGTHPDGTHLGGTHPGSTHPGETHQLVSPTHQLVSPTHPGAVDTNCSGIPHHSPAEFQDHEWSKHGVCAGTVSSVRLDTLTTSRAVQGLLLSLIPPLLPLLLLLLLLFYHTTAVQEYAMRRTSSPRSASPHPRPHPNPSLNPN